MSKPSDDTLDLEALAEEVIEAVHAHDPAESMDSLVYSVKRVLVARLRAPSGETAGLEERTI